MSLPSPLTTDIAQGQCLPFVGAGFSKNAVLPDGLHLPDWNELAALLATHLGPTTGLSPLEIAQCYERQFGRVQLIETIRVSLLPDVAKPGRAHAAFAQLPFETIYTTNFDMLLEGAYSSKNRPFRSLVGELQMPFHAGQTASNIVKMHGDLRHEEHIVVTQKDYDEFLDRYPVIATHLSAMLITRTPLFIGYSLSDPDFGNVRKVVRERLGRFERMAYVVQFDTDPAAIEAALEQHLHIISLDGSMGYDAALEAFFNEIQQQLDTRAALDLRTSRPDMFEPLEAEVVRHVTQEPDQSSLVESTSRMAFVMMPMGPKSDRVYRSLLAPVLEESGLKALRADEIQGTGFIIEQIRAAIQQSRICIADITGANPNVLYEIGYAEAAGKPIVLIAEAGADLPFDVAAQRVLFYGPELDDATSGLKLMIRFALSDELLEEADRLLRAGHGNAAIATAAVVLEQDLRSRLARWRPRGLDRMGLGELVRRMEGRKGVDSGKLAQLKDVVSIRNQAVHGLEPLPLDSARFVVQVVADWIEG
jgi:hypothetical protein